MRAPRRENDSQYETAPWAKEWTKKAGYRHKLRVMLDHDEIRVDEHVERYTLSRVGEMWKSYLATGMSAQDDKDATIDTNGMASAPTMEEIFGSRP